MKRKNSQEKIVIRRKILSPLEETHQGGGGS